jgi:hypothetical protein
LGLGIQFWEGIPETHKERRILVVSFVLPYVIVLGSHILWKVFSAPYKLHQKQNVKLARVEDRIKAIEDPSPEVMLSFSFTDNSKENAGIVVQNLGPGTAHKIRIHAKDGKWDADFGVIPYLASGDQKEVSPKVMYGKNGQLTSLFENKFIGFVRYHHENTSLDAWGNTNLLVKSIYENDLGIAFEQDFSLSFNRPPGARGKAGMLKLGSRKRSEGK